MADITYIRDPGVNGATFVIGGTVAILPVDGQVIPVYIASGSVAININPGDVNIGSVELYDAVSGKKARVLTANSAKASSESVVMAQVIDQSGEVLSQTTLADIDTNTASANVLLLDVADSANAIQETGSRQLSQSDALYSAVVTGNSLLAQISNQQGTQSTEGLALDASVAATNALLNQVNSSLVEYKSLMTAVLNEMGTLSSRVGQIEERSLLTAILNQQGTMASSTSQVAIAETLSSTIATLGKTGTDSPAHTSALIDVNPYSASADSFGRLRVSNPDYRFDSQLTYGVTPDLWDVATNSTGTVAFDATDRLAVLTCPANGTVVMQSHYSAPYTPGRSQLAFVTFVMGSTPPANTYRRVGYAEAFNGIFLEQTSSSVNLVIRSSTNNGSQTVPQSSWNIDKMDGTGPSKYVLDLTKAQILVITLQALYVGRVVVGFDIGGVVHPVHQFVHANETSYPYIAQANLPIRYEVGSTGVNTTSMKAICSSIISEGGGPLLSIPARTFSASNGITTVPVGARRPVMSIRARENINGVRNRAIAMPLGVAIRTNADTYIEVVRNASTLTGASWVAADSASGMDYDVSATALTGGTVILSGVSQAGYGFTASVNENLLSRIVLAYSHLLQQGDTLTVVGTSFLGNSATSATINWKEIR